MTPAELKAAEAALMHLESAIRALIRAENRLHAADLGITAGEVAENRQLLRRIEGRLGLGLENI